MNSKYHTCLEESAYINIEICDLYHIKFQGISREPVAYLS